MKLRRVTEKEGIFDDLIEHSFSMLDLDDDGTLQSLLSRVEGVLDSWNEQTYDDALEIGRQMPVVESGREFLAVKKGVPVVALIPAHVLPFCMSVFDEQNRLAARLFSDLARELNVAPDAVLEKGLRADEISSSFLHLFRYRAAEVAVPCREHTDSGLVTVIPRALGGESGGLECLSRKTKEFVKVEELFPDRTNVCCVLVGECLSALSNGRIQATVHRVCRSNRVSIPFQLRPAADSDILNRLKL